ncbi:MAG: phospholipid/cholesterol/gamma-HCH transport system substrate-binding protein [Actinomycetota bacterium]|jgi:phospholipid/cholesterol/gamma-HCH transport system substrate-binding protein|nr:phospholipid/cholesterol/gamma-HCH transport system substrate-binding protein [Actinomycetota bacterium]
MSVKNFRERSPVIIGLISILAIAAATTFAFSIDKIPSLKSAFKITADFRDAAGLTAENQVRVAGIKVGSVADIQLDGDHVHVTMEIDKGTQIPKGAFAEIKLATILGTKFVDIEAKGGAPYMEDGDSIALEDTAIPYEIYQASNQGTNLLEDLDGPALNDALVELTKLINTSKVELGEALAGLNELGAGLNDKEEDIRSLLANSNDLTALLADEGDEINNLIVSSDAVLSSLAQKREEIQSLLEAAKLMSGQLAGVLKDNRENVDAILSKLHKALVVLDRNVEHLDVALEYVGPSSRYFGEVFSQGRWGDIFNCAPILTAGCP